MALAVAAPAVPLIVALLARRHPTWVPDLDLALTELRVRDVGGAHSPLVGLPGRIGTLQQQGSHPGPISFYLLAPVYRLLGSTSFALQAATVILHVAAATVAVGLVGRRAGRGWALAVSGALLAFVAAIGPGLFTEPWNPYLPLLWWPAFLVGVWCALQGDAVGLAVVVVAGSICGQTHVPYLGPVGVLTALAVAGWARRSDAGHRLRRLAAVALLAAALWAPPVLDQLVHHPGNASLLADHLLSPSEPEVGVRDGGRLVLEHLDLAHLVRATLVDAGRLGERYPTGASAGRGALTAAVLGAVIVVGARRSTQEAGAAALVVLVATVAALLAAARILGYPWGYLTLWMWPLGLAAALAAVATVVTQGGDRVALRRGQRPTWLALLGLLLVAALTTAAVVPARRAAPTNPIVGRTVLALVPDVVAALQPGGRYLVTWSDSIHLGAHGYGLFDELERRGVDVVVPASYATQFGRHRAVGGDPVTGQLVVATGQAIERWVDQPGRELASVDVRTTAERAEARRVRVELVSVLRHAGLDRLVPSVDDNLFAVAFDPQLPAAARPLLDRLDVLGAPAAVFLVPAGAELP